MPNMRVTTKATHVIMVPVSGTVKIRLEVGVLGTGPGEVCDWGLMLWGVGVRIVEGAAVLCNMLLVCDLDDPVCCWLDVGCTVAMDATILKPYGSQNRGKYFYSIRILADYRDFLVSDTALRSLVRPSL